MQQHYHDPREPNSAYENFFNILFETYDKHFLEVKELKAMKYILGK